MGQVVKLPQLEGWESFLELFLFEKKEDFNLPSFEITIPDNVAKTRKKRTLPLSPVVAKEIKKLLFLQPLEWRDTTVFCSFEGKELSTASFGRRLNKYSCQIGYKITSYDLRHSFALLYLRNGGNVFTLQRTLGHTDLNMTKRYLALTGEDLKAEHEKATPVSDMVGKRVRRVREKLSLPHFFSHLLREGVPGFPAKSAI